MARRRKAHLSKDPSPIAPQSDAKDSFRVLGTFYLSLTEILKTGAVDSMAITYIENTTAGLIFYAFLARAEKSGSFCTRKGIYPSATQCASCEITPSTNGRCIYARGQYAVLTVPWHGPGLEDSRESFVYRKYLDCLSGSP